MLHSELARKSITTLFNKAPQQVVLTSVLGNDGNDIAQVFNALQQDFNEKNSVNSVDIELVRKDLECLEIALREDRNQELDDIAKYVSDELSYEVYYNYIGDNFSEMIYLTSLLTLFILDIRNGYDKLFKDNFKQLVAKPSERLQENLNKLGFNADVFISIEADSSILERKIKSTLKERFEKAKPGIFTSKHCPDSQGSRMVSKMKGCENYIKKEAKQVARSNAKRLIDIRLEEISRLKQLI